MTFMEIIKAIVEIGVTPVLLVAFIWYFFEKDKHRDKQLDDIYSNFKDRENILIAEGSRREELLRSESEKREKLMRQEAEKRENTLMATIERQGSTMERISETMNKIQISHVQVLEKVNNIEINLERLRSDGQT